MMDLETPSRLPILEIAGMNRWPLAVKTSIPLALRICGAYVVVAPGNWEIDNERNVMPATDPLNGLRK